MNQLNVQAIFNSIDGEVNGFHGTGEMCTFIRLKGCSLNCKWCDTEYAQNPEPKNLMTINEILAFPKLLNKITITGGEPLLQRTNLTPLVDKLLTSGHRITIETNGSEPPLSGLWFGKNKLLRYVMDYKLPCSQMEDHMNISSFALLSKYDVIKFVIANHTDYYIARDLVVNKTDWVARKVFSPLLVIDKFYENWPTELAEMMLEDYEILQDVQFSLQLHKILWPNAVQER
ncbi:MAG: 7-carboxy-7-deazaguanine synthase QueE [Candidatus Heimdallarchaeaceae archaeon]